MAAKCTKIEKRSCKTAVFLSLKMLICDVLSSPFVAIKSHKLETVQILLRSAH